MRRAQPNRKHTRRTPAVERMWKSMRILRTFDRGTLIATAEVGEHSAARYIRALRVAGYLGVAGAVHRGERVQYILRANTGPLPPRVQDGGLYDGNLAQPRQSIALARLRQHAQAMRRVLDGWPCAEQGGQP